jgi:NDP-mannose synthase
MLRANDDSRGAFAMKAVILAGGLGTRLRPYTTVLPKALVPVGDRPILEHILHRLTACGVTEVDLCIGHLGELIQAYFSQGSTLPPDLELRWHWEDEPLGTAGALTRVDGLDETFIAMNGDILTTLDYRELVRHHHQSGAVLTVAMHAGRVDVDLGVIEHSDGFITGYREKPTLHYDASMGIYVYEPRAFEFVPRGQPFQFPDLVLRMLDEGEPVAAYPSAAEWYDIGTLGEYERATDDFNKRPELFAV